MIEALRHLTIAQAEGVATVLLDRPPVNAVDLEVIDEFLRVVPELAADRAVRAVIITGRERRFCAGADIAMLRDLSVENQRRARRWVDVQAGLEAMEKPVVAAINGYALGGGAELALACDVRLMARGGEIGFPEIRLGFFPGAGGTQRLTRVVGPTRALRLMMEGRRLTADEARALGIVDEVVPADLLQQTARDVAERLAAGPTRAMGLLKRCVYQGHGRPLTEGLAIEAEAVAELIRTADAREGMTAFLEKRPPRFSGT
ncbi:MAG TPA: enoyl-CoA hydratase-related protein [Methylomirabilota bacterium]|jgi:enoyl-CoA hydratase|nr:enoyl-CoA hydratase-related protein [Methylomirabilota bacterium]